MVNGAGVLATLASMPINAGLVLGTVAPTLPKTAAVAAAAAAAAAAAGVAPAAAAGAAPLHSLNPLNPVVLTSNTVPDLIAQQTTMPVGSAHVEMDATLRREQESKRLAVLIQMEDGLEAARIKADHAALAQKKALAEKALVDAQTEIPRTTRAPQPAIEQQRQLLVYQQHHPAAAATAPVVPTSALGVASARVIGVKKSAPITTYGQPKPAAPLYARPPLQPPPPPHGLPIYQMPALPPPTQQQLYYQQPLPLPLPSQYPASAAQLMQPVLMQPAMAHGNPPLLHPVSIQSFGATATVSPFSAPATATTPMSTGVAASSTTATAATESVAPVAVAASTAHASPATLSSPLKITQTPTFPTQKYKRATLLPAVPATSTGTGIITPFNQAAIDASNAMASPISGYSWGATAATLASHMSQYASSHPATHSHSSSWSATAAAAAVAAPSSSSSAAAATAPLHTFMADA